MNKNTQGPNPVSTLHRPVSVTVLEYFWWVIGTLSILLGATPLDFVINLANRGGYKDLVSILSLGLGITVGIGVISVLVGYGLLEAKRWAWKIGVGVSLLYIILGMVVIVSVLFTTPLSGVISIFAEIFTISVNKFPLLIIITVTAKLCYTLGGIALLVLLMRNNVRSFFGIQYEVKKNVILRRTAIVAVAGIALAIFGYGYTTGIFGMSDIGSADKFAPYDGVNSTNSRTSEWSIAAEIPIQLDEGRAAAIGSKIYLVGGALANFTTINTVEVYDSSTNTWSYGKPLPIPLNHVAAESYQGKLYVVGGYMGSLGFTPSNALFIFDPSTNEWTRGENMPTGRGALTAQFVNGVLYAIGGQNHMALTTNEAYDPATNTWTTKAPMPTPRDHLASGVVDGKLYVIGGRQGNTFTNLNVNEEYDPEKDEWVIKAPMPTTRGGITAGSLSDSIYVFCGDTLTRVFSNTEQYIPSLDRWIVRDSMPTARHGCAAAEVGGSIFVIGGGSDPGLAVSDENEVFTPTDWKKTWIAPENLDLMTPETESVS